MKTHGNPVLKGIWPSWNHHVSPINSECHHSKFISNCFLVSEFDKCLQDFWNQRGLYLQESCIPIIQVPAYCLLANATCLNLRSTLLELQWPEISQYRVRYNSSSWSTYNKLCGQETLHSIMWETKVRGNVDFSREKKRILHQMLDALSYEWEVE